MLKYVFSSRDVVFLSLTDCVKLTFDAFDAFVLGRGSGPQTGVDSTQGGPKALQMEGTGNNPSI